MIKKILIANRGEIALRIIRACKEMNIETVAIYSSADKDSLPIALADEAICVGSFLAKDSYLHIPNIIQAALATNCDAIHPGFGFLSENANFARLVSETGLIFIGPNYQTIAKLGDKNQARQMMAQANIPIIKGSDGPIHSLKEARKLAKEIDYPIIIKAVNGGGGRGMRICYEEAELENNFKACKSEALACFNSDLVYIEKYLLNPKHIEVQILADNFNNVIHLYERDCSFQRRNQKLIEEAPCQTLDAKLKEQLLTNSVKAAKKLGYNSVGTIEYLVDANNNFYFMEMNTRIQVEHPVTEMICNVDIVKEQIKVAANQKLSYSQADIRVSGHAIECRINAEDIYNDFKPSPNTIKKLHLPGGNGIRIETAVYTDYTIPPYYDSMILKLIAHGQNRLECIRKMRFALEELVIEGVKTNIPFHYYTLYSHKFIRGRYDTSLASHLSKELNDARRDF